MTKKGVGSFFLFVLTLSWAAFYQNGPAEAQVDAAALSRAMNSIAVISVETKDGKENRGLAFLTSVEGKAVTAAHLLKNASRVILRFQDGTETLSSGVIAIDEKRGLAMLDIPSSGRAGLTMVQVSISPGTMVYCGAVRDNTYGFVQLSVSEVHQGSFGVERYVLSGEAPEGNSGSPALDQKGNVTGMVIDTGEGKVLVPSAFIVAIGDSSPLKSWGGEVPETVDAPQADPGPGPMDEIDQAILDFLVMLYDHDSVYRWGQEKTMGKGYLEGVPEDVYHYQTRLEIAIKKLGGVETDDRLRKKIIKNLSEAGNNQVIAVNCFIQAVVAGQGARDWGAQSQDLNKRAKAAINIAGEVLLTELPAIQELYERSTVFGEKMHRDIKYYLGIEKRVAPFAIGAVTTIGEPFRMIVLYHETFGEALGLKAGDKILSAAGSKFDDGGSMEDFKAVILENLGKTIDVIVERNGEQTTLKMKIPGEIPDKYLIPQIL